MYTAIDTVKKMTLETISFGCPPSVSTGLTLPFRDSVNDRTTMAPERRKTSPATMLGKREALDGMEAPL